MNDKLSFLLVHEYEFPLTDLKPVLDRLGFKVLRARSCAEANFLLASPEPPAVVFTDTELPDGSWSEIVSLASQTQSAAPVIVVSSVLDLTLYLDVSEGGAADFIVPPFQDEDIHYVAEGAMMRSQRMSSFLSRPAHPTVPPCAYRSSGPPVSEKTRGV
ncbi:MAG TPA: response regulator [Terriglobia bacterium]|nr:response regulator [Terriglobia bacterium]